jgi:hypothetical protein
MSRNQRLAERATLAMLLSLAVACSSAANPPPTVSTAVDASDDAEAGDMSDVDVDGPLTPEGCQQGQACVCVGAAGVCQGGSAAPRSCAMSLDCEPNRMIQLADMLCISMGGDGGRTCAKRCAKMGGCSASPVTCPSGYVCESPPIPVGNGGPVCIVPSMLQPLQCTQDVDCASIPGSKCTASGCILECTN